jgi:hypothetical protein
MSGLDRLEALVVRQHALQVRLNELPAIRFPTPEARLEYLRTMVLACTAELHEALEETGWKTWVSSNHINEDRAFSELCDALQFLLNCMFAVCPQGTTPQQVARWIDDYHVAKVKVNLNRHIKGYDGVSTKCNKCKRALDDLGVKCTVNHCADPQYALHNARKTP